MDLTAAAAIAWFGYTPPTTQPTRSSCGLTFDGKIGERMAEKMSAKELAAEFQWILDDLPRGISPGKHSLGKIKTHIAALECELATSEGTRERAEEALRQVHGAVLLGHPRTDEICTAYFARTEEGKS